MGNPGIRVLVSVDLRGRSYEEIVEIWQLVIVHAMLREGADRFMAEGLPRSPESPGPSARAYGALATMDGVEQASDDSLSGPLTSETRPLVRDIGPFLVNVGLDRGPTWVAGISDWGTAIDFNADLNEWEKIKVRVGARFEVTPLAE